MANAQSEILPTTNEAYTQDFTMTKVALLIWRYLYLENLGILNFFSTANWVMMKVLTLHWLQNILLTFSSGVLC